MGPATKNNFLFSKTSADATSFSSFRNFVGELVGLSLLDQREMVLAIL